MATKVGLWSVTSRRPLKAAHVHNNGDDTHTAVNRDRWRPWVTSEGKGLR